jgi:hypothetical protein
MQGWKIISHELHPTISIVISLVYLKFSSIIHLLSFHAHMAFVYFSLRRRISKVVPLRDFLFFSCAVVIGNLLLSLDCFDSKTSNI